MDAPASVVPAVSAVVPCRNEARGIEACIRSILDQEPPPGGFEVIVADGLSDDGTREILDRIRAGDPRLQVVDNPERITPCAMNAGIRAARGRYIAIMGAHNRYAPDYLRRCVETLEQTAADDVGGAVFAEATTYVERAVAASHHSRFSVGGSRWHDPAYEGPADTVWGGCYRREVFARIGLFDEELVRNQDDELNLRLTRSGGRIWQSPRIRSCYTPRGSLGALFGQYRQYGYWKVRVIRKHRLPASPRHLVPGAFVLSVAISAVLCTPLPGRSTRRLTRGSRRVLAAVGCAYAGVNLVASAATARRSGWELLPVLPAVFACYHVGYGIGFIEAGADLTLRGRAPRSAAVRLTR